MPAAKTARERLLAITNIKTASPEDLKYKQYSEMDDAAIQNLVKMVESNDMTKDFAIAALFRVVSERPQLQKTS